MLSILRTIILSTLLMHVTKSFSISHDRRSTTTLFSHSQTTTTTTTSTTIQQQQHAIDLIIQAKAKKYFSAIADHTVTNKKQKLVDTPVVEEIFLTFALNEHKPMGCTAEESLVKAEDGSKHVFISKVIQGGNADMAGVEVGDVIVGVSGSFEDVFEVIGTGLDRVRSLIAGREKEMNLVIKVVRNTNVQTVHEKALVDLCILPEGEAKDSNLSKCIEALYGPEFEIDNVEGPKACEDTDTECMLDTMLESWESEVNEVMGIMEAEEKKNPLIKTEKESKGWSWSKGGGSRSGTYVLDPKTRKMVNIDD